MKPASMNETNEGPLINTPNNQVEHSDLLESRKDKSDEASLYSYVCLIIILFISMGNQWQRYLIAYAQNATNDSDPLPDGTPRDGNPKYDIKAAYVELQTPSTFALLAGPAFGIAFATFGIYAGYLSDNYNRKKILVGASFIWSTCTFLSGTIESFPVLVVLRFFLAVFESAFGPLAYSLIADLFHPNKRTLAAAIFNLGIYFGGALASLSTILVLQVGWKLTYKIVGLFGIAVSVLAQIVIKEPVRGYYDVKKDVSKDQIQVAQKTVLQKFSAALSETFSVPTCRWSLIGGSFRFFGGYSIAFFMPSYFNVIYADYKTQYSVLNAVIVSLCGLISSYAGGWISDTYEKKGYFMTKAYICMFAGLAGIPTMFFCTMLQTNFWLSISFLGAEYLVAECFFSPAIAMVLNTISVANRGFAVSVYLFCATIAGTFATWLLGQLATTYDAKTNTYLYGRILFIFVCISYGGSVPFFYLAGRTYTKVKKTEAAEAIEIR